MRIFLDTEFTDFLNCELLSLGLVTERGEEFYAELVDTDRSLCSDFARVAVLPQLDRDPAASCIEAELSLRLLSWLSTFRSAEPLMICVDHPTDWELFTYLVRDPETLLTPPWMKGQSIAAAIDPRRVEEYWEVHGRRSHHALHDARANRYAYLRGARSES